MEPCSSAGSPSTRKTGRPNGLPVPYRSREQEVQVAILGDIRSEFQAGGNWKSKSAVGEGRAQPVYAGQELNWCTKCHHSSADCPYQTRKCPWSTVAGSTGGTPRNSRNEQRLKYNRYQENCRFGRECHFQHVCSNCRGPYPVSRCKAGATQQTRLMGYDY